MKCGLPRLIKINWKNISSDNIWAWCASYIWKWVRLACPENGKNLKNGIRLFSFPIHQYHQNLRLYIFLSNEKVHLWLLLLVFNPSFPLHSMDFRAVSIHKTNSKKCKWSYFAQDTFFASIFCLFLRFLTLLNYFDGTCVRMQLLLLFLEWENKIPWDATPKVIFICNESILFVKLLQML